MYIHLCLRFSDGDSWLARILRESYKSFADGFGNDIINHECAILRWLETINVRAPRLHGYGLRSDPSNKVGVGFMLIDELPGTALLFRQHSVNQVQKVYEQWANIMCNFEAHPFGQMGSLIVQPDDEISIGAIVVRRQDEWC